MRFVIDASAVVELLLTSVVGLKVADQLESAGVAWSVGHMDAEVLSALGRLHRAGALDDREVDDRLELLGAMDVDRLPITSALLRDAWALRDRIALRDALYVAAAVRMDGTVLTTDDRLRRAAPDRTTGPS